MSLDVPVCFCIFNRPDTAARVFEQIRLARPRRLLVVGDGPRADRPGEKGLVGQCRALIDQVDWPCDVETCLAATNLGCARRMASGLTWAFSRAERLIVLEDDCVPSAEFFSFCESLLDRYADDDRVTMISGDNFCHVNDWPASYYFSRWGHIWGWASWRRAWHYYQLELSEWPELRNSNFLESLLGDAEQAGYWSHVFDSVLAGQIDTWDYSWQLAIFRQRGLVVLPNRNLITNIGHDSRATHTTDPQCRFANLPVESQGPLVHPSAICRHEAADAWTFANLFRPSKVHPAAPSPHFNWWRRMIGSGRRRRAA